MLSLYVLSKYNIKPSSKILFQWINISVRLCSSSSSASSSSDSSDSDSDTEKTKSKHVESTSSASTTSDNKYDLESFVNNTIQARKLQKTIDVAMYLKKKSKDKTNNKYVPFEKKIINAAEDVANTLGGDKTKTTSDLLEKVLASRVEALRTEQARIKTQKNVNAKEIKFKQLPKDNIQESSQNKHLGKKSIIQTLLDEYNEKPVKPVKVVEVNKHSEKKSIMQTLLDEYNEKLVKPVKVVEVNKRSEKKSIMQTLLDEYNEKPVKPMKVVEVNKHSEKKSIMQTLLDEYNEKPVKPMKVVEVNKYSEKKSIMQTLLDEYNEKPVKVIEDSISRRLLNSVKAHEKQLKNTERKHTRFQEIDLWNGKSTIIFENLNTAPLNIPELKTWAALEQRELKALTTHPPANIFQELILWTEQGKLWKFPIDNEQGIEEEHSVHFSEHIFMERHLKEWCPKSGPIRHFMELVCIGLSKNPYLTVQEKIAHIMWYKEYFKSKQDILQETGAIQEPFPDTVKEISE